ncbi:MAG: alpha/beta hydrolase, partial [Synechococcaceae cyanobacterium]|nr:alpha/beta hydrolase [Synechococcaceae cyanobacterium]
SPQRGTLAAQLAPQAWLAGIADMKVGSPLLRELDRRASLLEPLDCRSLFCATDLTVFPGWRAVLPVGSRLGLPVLTHRQLIRDPLAVRRLADLLLEP